jgi:PHD/YefM family antitoxin component YafN of YafNO toxin-antitoxin module
MKTFTPTQLRDNSGAVYNEVMMGGPVSIKGKTRPEMVLMTAEQLKKIELIAYTKGSRDEYEALKQQEQDK